MTFREDHPRAFGAFTADLGPFPAESFQTLHQTYTIGEQEMAPGGGILVSRHYMSDYTLLQTDNPKADNYITVHSSNAAARFVPAKIKFPSVLHGSDPFEGDPYFFTLEGTALKKGDTITVTYGDTSSGSRGFQLASFAIDRYPLPLYLRFEKGGHFYSLPLQPIAVTGKTLKGVHGFAPSILGINEKFTLVIRSEDEYYNRATGPIPPYRVLLNGRLFKELPASDTPFAKLEGLSFSKPGIYRFTIESIGDESNDGAIHGIANPILVKDKPLTRVYWGEEHGHSGMAEGQGMARGYFRFARDDANLDFAAHTDHDFMIDDRKWEQVRQNVKKYYKEGEFITFLAYEWSASIPHGGHHNVFFRTPDGRKRVPEQTAAWLSDLYQTLREENHPRDVLVVPHYHQGDWRLSDPKLQNLVEIMSAHGTFEWYAQKFLDYGAQVGFAAGSDDHFNHPGYSSPWFRGGGMLQQGGLTAVTVTEKTGDAIFDALKKSRTYATTQERIILDITTNGAPMGTRVAFSPTRKIEGSIIGTGELESIDVIKNGKVVNHRDFVSSNKKTGRYLLTFESASNPARNLQLTARASRVWTGTVRVKGGTLKGVRTLGFDNPRVHKMERDANDPNLIHFVAITIGNNNGLWLYIDETPQTSIEVSLEPGEEYRVAASQPGENAPKIKHPAQHFDIGTNGLTKAGKTFNIPVPDMPYTDKVALRPINAEIPMEANFAFEDSDEFGVGDYYYVRVRQLDGALAWSSPVWIGGFPVQ